MNLDAPQLVLTVGLPGVGKTTWARAYAAEHAWVRLTPDEWMAPLFGDSDADGRRDVIEGRLLWVAREVLRAGASVIVDFGCWSPEERHAIRAMTELVGARFVLQYVELPEDVRRARCARRWTDSPHETFEMTDADHDRFLRMFRAPTPEELAYDALPPPPTGFGDWFHWASTRWPTLPRFD